MGDSTVLVTSTSGLLTSTSNTSLTNTSGLLTNCSSGNGTCIDEGSGPGYRLKAGARELSYVGLALMWLWAVMIISLNVTVIVIIRGYKKKTRLYFFLLNLAIADLAAGLFDAFPNAIQRSLGIEHAVMYWMAGDAFCKILGTVSNTCIMTSNYILAVLSLDRAYAICKPILSIQKGSILQKIIVLLCWLFCFLCSSPYLKFYRADNFKEKYSFSDKQHCDIKFSENATDNFHGHTINLYLKFILMFVVPLLIIAGSYILLVIFIFRRALHSTPSEKKADKERRGLNMSRVFNKGVPKSKMKSIRLTLGIVLSFIVCWMAYFIGYFISMHTTIRHPAFIVLTTFYYWNSIANPVLFFIYHRRKVRSSFTPSWTNTESSHLHQRSSAEPVVGGDRSEHNIPMLIKEDSPCT